MLSDKSIPILFIAAIIAVFSLAYMLSTKRGERGEGGDDKEGYRRFWGGRGSGRGWGWRGRGWAYNPWWNYPYDLYY